MTPRNPMAQKFVKPLLFTDESTPEERIRALTELVLYLLHEVEALRTLHAELAPDDEQRRRYREAYRKASLLAHNAAGPTTGTEKLIRAWLAPPGEPREVALLLRLGCTDEEVKQFKRNLEFASSLS